MGKATGRANHPHDSRRPESAAVKLGIEIFREEGNIEPLRHSLSPRQRAFCEEYILDFNGCAACIRAGYAKKFADRQAYLLMKNEGVAAYIDFLTGSKEAKIVSMDPDYLLVKLAGLMNKEGARDSDVIRCVELAMKHFGMFIDRTEITGKDGEAIRIQQQKVQEEAEGFLTAIRRIADKNEKKEVTIV